ncbi:hypothetical protein M9458_034467, partial [Cirrhinus mrigala]
FQVKQNITYRDCTHGPRSGLETQELRIERIFVMYVKEERILRYAITNKIGPLRGRMPAQGMNALLETSKLVFTVVFDVNVVMSKS